MLKRNRNGFVFLIYVLFALFYIWLAEQIPYTHDDWDWGLPIGIEQWLTASLNSRYVGNFFEVVMTRSEFLKTLIMGTGYFLIPFMIAEIASDKNTKNTLPNWLSCFIFCNVMLLSMDRKIWQQTYGWVAGYANFVISSIFLLIIIKKVLKAFEKEQIKRPGKKECLVFFLITFLGQLFLENVAIFLCVLFAAVNLYIYIREKRIFWIYIWMALGALAGLFVIFGSNIYQELWSSGSAVDGYRHLYFNSETNIINLVDKCLHQAINLPYRIWENNLILCLTILALLNCALLYRTESVNGKWRATCIVVNLGYCVYFIVNYILELTIHLAILSLINGGFFLVVACEVLLLFSKSELNQYKFLSVWVCVPMVILPLVVTSESGPRLFFTSNVLLVLFAAMLFEEVKIGVPEKIRTLGMTACAVAIVVLILFHGRIYYEIGKCKEQRNSIITQAITTTPELITLPQYPYLDYLWIPNPKSEQRITFFKEFYNIPDSINVVFQE